MRNNYFCLRCALTGFEINYRIRIPFNQINKGRIRFFSSNVIPQQQNFALTHKMDPSFITGFVDGEGCFTIIIGKRSRVKVGRVVQLFFFKLFYIIKINDYYNRFKVTLPWEA